MTRTVTIEAIALRANARAQHAEQDALVLQDDLLAVRKQVEQLTAGLDAANMRIKELETHGTTS